VTPSRFEGHGIFRWTQNRIYTTCLNALVLVRHTMILDFLILSTLIVKLLTYLPGLG